MRFVRAFFRIALMPIVLLLTAIHFLLAFLLVLSTRVLAIISSLGITLSLLLFVTGDYRNGGIQDAAILPQFLCDDIHEFIIGPFYRRIRQLLHQVLAVNFILVHLQTSQSHFYPYMCNFIIAQLHAVVQIWTVTFLQENAQT